MDAEELLEQYGIVLDFPVRSVFLAPPEFEQPDFYVNGFDCVDEDAGENAGCYLTYHAVDRYRQWCEQLHLDKAAIRWLIEEGLPTVLEALENGWPGPNA